MRWLILTLLLLTNQVNKGQRIVNVVDFQQLEKTLNPTSDSVYVVNFWATWCVPCVLELPEFKKAEKFFSRDKVRFIYVSLDFEEQIQSRLIPFLEQRKFGSEVVVLKQDNADEWIPKIDKKWSGAIPATMFISPRNRQFHEGTLSFEQLKKQIETFKNQ